MSVNTAQVAPIFDVDASSFQANVLDASHDTPVLVDYWAEWCAPCKALGPVLEKIVTASNGAVRLAKIDIDSNQEFAGQHAIRSIPTVRLFVDGAAVAEFMGAQPESAIHAFLKQHLPDNVHAAQAQQSDAHHAIETLLQGGQPEQAAVALQALDDEERRTPSMQRLRARIDLARQAIDCAPLERLQARIAADGDDIEARFDFGLRQAGDAQWDGAIETLLGVLAKNRSFNDGAARKLLLLVFEALGEGDERVNLGRSRLATLLN